MMQVAIPSLSNIPQPVEAIAKADVAKYPDYYSPPHRVPRPVPRHVPKNAPSRSSVQQRTTTANSTAGTFYGARNEGDPWEIVQRAFGRPGATLKPPSGTARADIQSGAIAEAALVRKLEQQRSTGSGRRRAQRGAVEEAERIVRSPKQPKVPTYAAYDYKGISDRQNQAVDRRRAMAKRVAAAATATLAGIGVAKAINSFRGGGRGGGFHKRALTFRPGDKGLRTAF